MIYAQCVDSSGSSGRRLSVPGTPSGSAEDWGVQKRLQFVLSHLDPPVGRLLDVGCGKGAYLDTLSLRSSMLVGIDSAGERLVTARSRRTHPNIHLAQMEAEQLAFADGSFDAATMIETLEHLADGVAAIREVARLLRPGGMLLISVPNRLFPFETHPVRVGDRLYGSRWGTAVPLIPLLPHSIRRHFATARPYSVWDLCGLVAAGGFVVHNVDYLMPGLDPRERDQASMPLARRLRRLGAWAERSPLRRFGSTILVYATRQVE
jgi:SAM-dependent methyltransferase